MERTFKDRLAESLVPLVVALACAAAAWSAGPMTDPWHWGGLAATVAVAYAIHKVCSVNSVIPLRTWILPIQDAHHAITPLAASTIVQLRYA